MSHETKAKMRVRASNNLRPPAAIQPLPASLKSAPSTTGDRIVASSAKVVLFAPAASAGFNLGGPARVLDPSRWGYNKKAWSPRLAVFALDLPAEAPGACPAWFAVTILPGLRTIPAWVLMDRPIVVESDHVVFVFVSGRRLHRALPAVSTGFHCNQMYCIPCASPSSVHHAASPAASPSIRLTLLSTRSCILTSHSQGRSQVQPFAHDAERVPLGQSFQKSVTLCAPHLKELINVTTDIKMPSLSLYLAPELAESSTLAKNVKKELAYASLRTATAAVEIWYSVRRH
ncbi:hypothetical protein L210DRAFT_985700 [Boletus edulis BED1]|uniref:Uncharacterized protein n=1 Tax=Boletus edulis BED1 TaxID=1328754 RepID=A0AAD4BF41_BOLED|nr:hypothetical protein L210DRAFT_985700 [Boletus edulis BED1]